MRVNLRAHHFQTKKKLIKTPPTSKHHIPFYVTVIFAIVALIVCRTVSKIGAAVVVVTFGALASAIAVRLAQSGNVYKSEYTIAPHVGNVAQTTINVKMVGPIPAMHCNISGEKYFYLHNVERFDISIKFNYHVLCTNVCHTSNYSIRWCSDRHMEGHTAR